MPPKANSATAPATNPLAALLGGGAGGNSPITPEMAQLAMSALPQLIKFAQRIPAWSLGYFVGILWWVVVVPLTSSSILTFGGSEDGVAVAGSRSGIVSSRFGSNNEADMEWDDAQANIHNNKKNKKNNKKDDEDEDDDAQENNGKNPKQQESSPTLLNRLMQCNAVRGHSLMRCLYTINNMLLNVIVGLLLFAFVSSGAAIWWQNRQEEKRQHERAKAIVQDILQMNRKEKFD